MKATEITGSLQSPGSQPFNIDLNSGEWRPLIAPVLPPQQPRRIDFSDQSAGDAARVRAGVILYNRLVRVAQAESELVQSNVRPEIPVISVSNEEVDRWENSPCAPEESVVDADADPQSHSPLPLDR